MISEDSKQLREKSNWMRTSEPLRNCVNCQKGFLHKSHRFCYVVGYTNDNAVCDAYELKEIDIDKMSQ